MHKQLAAIQMASGPNVEANLFEAEWLIGKAVEAGAELIVLPENFALMGMSEKDKVMIRERPGEGRIQGYLSEQARRHGVWIVGGTVPLACPEPDKISAACLLFNDRGEQVARYDKIHLFDVHIVDSHERYKESETIASGKEAVVANTPFGRLGLAICYDLRFPELFRAMLDRDAELVAVPAAFTAITGKAHWECLVRARAIENLIYMIAAAQGGYHVNGRETFGDSMIVDPWGMVLDRLRHGSGVVVAGLDRGRLQSTRRNFPVIEHRRFVEYRRQGQRAS
jgi:deaminated glutathione amidase